MTEPLRFPPGFWWGCATSSHQVEGDCDNDWTRWEQRPGAIFDGSVSGRAARWWSGAAEGDLRQAAQWGHTATRISVEWSRLEPRPGEFNDAAFARYRQILGHAGDLGLARLVTLNHFTLPVWVADRGAWLAPDLPDRLAAFSSACARRLGDLVERWATLNEPSLVAMFGYAGTRWPPGRGSPLAFLTALRAMLTAHVRMYQAVHAVQPDAEVGLVLNMPRFDPARAHPLDRALARLQDWTVSGGLLHALRRGRAPLPLAAPYTSRAVVHGLDRSFDWLGLNYYGRYAVRFAPLAIRQALAEHVQRNTIRLGDTDWGQPHPLGLRDNLERLAALGAPVLVTENGIFDNDDSRRPDFIRTHVRAVHAALAAGVDVRGYFHWSLVDNFEWTQGWSTRFGLLALDPDTGARTPRPSAEVFAEICRNNAVASV